MDAFSLLKADHRKVEQLFAQLESASGKQKLQVFQQIKTELELHTHIEEKIFYPGAGRARGNARSNSGGLRRARRGQESAQRIRQSQDCDRRVGGAGQGVAGKRGAPR